jgi:hypothetical protein
MKEEVEKFTGYKLVKPIKNKYMFEVLGVQDIPIGTVILPLDNGCGKFYNFATVNIGQNYQVLNGSGYENFAILKEVFELTKDCWEDLDSTPHRWEDNAYSLGIWLRFVTTGWLGNVPPSKTSYELSKLRDMALDNGWHDAVSTLEKEFVLQHREPKL